MSERVGLWAPERRALTVGLIVVITLVAFESLAVVTVMTAVARDLGGLELYGWAFSAFFLGNLVGIVFAGLLIDRYGPVRPFAIGATLFAFGLLVGGLAPTMPLLVLGRLVQGFGGAAVPTVAYVAIGRGYPAAVRPRMFALLSTAWVVPGIVGPGLAGVVADQLSWRLVFLALIPVVGVAGVVVLRSLRTLPALTDEADLPDARRRLAAAIAVALGAGLLLTAATITRPLETAALAVAGLAIGLPALRRLLPPGTLRAARGIPSVVLARGCSTFAFFGAEAFVPLALVSLRDLSLAEAGLLLTAATLTWTAGAWVQAHLVTRVGQSRLIGAGFVFLSVGLAGVASVLVPTVPVAATIAAWGCGGFGMGLLYSAMTQVVLVEARPEEQGAASSAINLSDVLGSAIGTGAGGAIVAYGEAAGLGLATALAAVFAVMIGVAAAGIVVSTRLEARGGPVAAGG